MYTETKTDTFIRYDSPYVLRLHFVSLGRISIVFYCYEKRDGDGEGNAISREDLSATKRIARHETSPAALGAEYQTYETSTDVHYVSRSLVTTAMKSFSFFLFSFC